MKTESKRLTKTEFDQALTTPGSVFDTPMEVVRAPDLSRSEKIEILKRWELDARALQRATDESMGGGEHSPLDAVNQALAVLDPGNKTPDGFGNAPTKI
jgi:hypothetical protein